MARAGLLHVTVIAATLLRDASGSDSEPADTYASVGCGNQNFTTNTVKNHKTKPTWNESYTFKFEEKNELESQHILIEIFVEKPKLDELIGLAKIPLHKVIAAGDEISTHSLTRPDEEYIGQEQYSGNVKVALRWDSAKASAAPAYPQTYTPAARYNPNATTAKPPALARQSTRSGEQLPTSRSGEELYRQEECYGDGQEKRAHQRSSSYPSRTYNLRSSAPSPSQSPWKDPPISDENHLSARPSNASASGVHPSPGPSPRPSSVGTGSDGSQHHHHGRQSSVHVPYSGPHVPYVPHQGNGVPGHAHLAYQKPVESSQASLDQKQQDDVTKLKLSKSKQAEMAKLAELSRLTESAKIQATGFAKAGQQPSSRPKASVTQQQQQPQTSSMQKSDGLLSQMPHRSKFDGTCVQQNHTLQQSQDRQQNLAPQRLNEAEIHPPIQQQLTNGPPRPQNVDSSKQLAVVPTGLDIVEAQPKQKEQNNEIPQQLRYPQQSADVFYEKAIQKAENSERKKKSSPFRQTMKMLRKSAKIFGI